MLLDVLGILIVGAVCVYVATELIRLFFHVTKGF